MNELEKPEKCSEHDCNNKAYAKDKITKDQWRWVCKKHHFQFAYGIDYPRETVRGGIKVKPIIVIGGIGQSGKKIADKQEEKINNLIRKPHKRDLATFPHLKLGERIYWQVGCTNCGKADKYKVHYDGANGLAIQCECGRITRWEQAKLQPNPDSYPNYFNRPNMTTHFSQ